MDAKISRKTKIAFIRLGKFKIKTAMLTNNLFQWLPIYSLTAS